MHSKSVRWYKHVKQSIAEASFLIDRVASIHYASFVHSVSEVVQKLKSGIDRDLKIVENAKHELEQLKDMAERIYALQEDLSNASMRIARVIEMLKDRKAEALILNNPAFSDIHVVLQGWKEKPATQSVSLRSAIEAYLGVVAEAKVGDIVTFLQAIGFDYAKRQTVEGVIKRHPYDFRVIKKGREKFIRKIRAA